MKARIFAEENKKWWTLAAVSFGLFMIMLDNTIVNVALPSIQRALHTSPENLEWTINAYVISFGALILLGGKLGDRYGRRRIFMVGLVVFTLASAACALAQTDNQLIGARIVQGFGGAMLNPLSLSILVSAFPRKQLPTAIGVWAGISGLGLAVGPLLGGFLVEQYSWSAVFWVNVPVGIIALGVTAWAVRESRDPNAHSLDVIGTVLVTSSLFLLIWGLIKTNQHSWLSAYTLTFILIGAALMV
jgi:EmrB/QacA subfamily drug resistance transporter